jgi:DNA gyrase subunit A
MELLKYVREELAKVAERFKNEKRLTSISTETDDRDTIPDIDVVMAYTHNGYIKSVKLDEYNSQKRNGTGSSFKTKEDDFVESIKTLSTQDDLVFIGASGKAYVLPAYKVPTVSKSSIGKPLNNYIPLDNDEHIIKFFVVTKEDKEDENLSLLLATKKGIGKRMLLSDLPQTRNGAKIMNLRTEDDMLVSAVLVNNDAEMLVISLKGQGLKFPVDKVSIMGRAAAGVRIMGLEDGDELVSAFTVTEDDQVLQVMTSGAAKRMKSSDIPAKINRGGKGVKVLTAVNRVGGVVTAGVVKETDDCIIVTKNGMVIRTPAKGISLQSRISNGVKAISLNGEDTIASVTVVDTNEENKTDE